MFLFSSAQIWIRIELKGWIRTGFNSIRIHNPGGRILTRVGAASKFMQGAGAASI
jgi:hypothetical protein